MSRYKPIGWRNESYRHSLAAKGLTKKVHPIPMSYDDVNRAIENNEKSIYKKLSKEEREEVVKAIKSGYNPTEDLDNYPRKKEDAENKK